MKTAAVVALKKKKETHQEVAADGGQRRHQKVCYDNVKTHRMGTGLQPSCLSCWQQLQGLASAQGKSGFQLRRKPALSSGLRLAWQGGRLRQSTEKLKIEALGEGGHPGPLARRHRVGE